MPKGFPAVTPVQILDGIGAGLQSVAVPALVAHVLNGTGRINVGQGSAMTVQGAGAAPSQSSTSRQSPRPPASNPWREPRFIARPSQT
jgi:hypothetical protein